MITRLASWLAGSWLAGWNSLNLAAVINSVSSWWLFSCLSFLHSNSPLSSRMF